VHKWRMVADSFHEQSALQTGTFTRLKGTR
jgi:hypothetical protein